MLIPYSKRNWFHLKAYGPSQVPARDMLKVQVLLSPPLVIPSSSTPLRYGKAAASPRSLEGASGSLLHHHLHPAGDPHSLHLCPSSPEQLAHHTDCPLFHEQSSSTLVATPSCALPGPGLPAHERTRDREEGNIQRMCFHPGKAAPVLKGVFSTVAKSPHGTGS